MSKFKVGDKVRVVEETYGYTGVFEVGNLGIIKRFQSEDTGFAVLTGDGDYTDAGTCWHELKNLELVEDTSGYHKHHDLIIQWAKGADIEYYCDYDLEWYSSDTPTWREDRNYRIKPPAPKTDKERIAELEDRVKELEDNL